MPKLAANLSMMFTDVRFLDRFAAAAAAGFEGVEFLFPYEFSPAEIAGRLNHHRLSHVLFNLPPGDWASGERGMAALPGREKEFMAGLDRALEFALATGCKQLHAMAGNWPAEANWRDGAAVYVDNLRRAADHVAEHDITVLIEPLNKRDNPGYFLNTTADATAILKEVGGTMSNCSSIFITARSPKAISRFTCASSRVGTRMCRSLASRISMSPTTAKSISHTY